MPRIKRSRANKGEHCIKHFELMQWKQTHTILTVLAPCVDGIWGEWISGVLMNSKSISYWWPPVTKNGHLTPYIRSTLHSHVLNSIGPMQFVNGTPWTKKVRVFFPSVSPQQGDNGQGLDPGLAHHPSAHCLPLHCSRSPTNPVMIFVWSWPMSTL